MYYIFSLFIHDISLFLVGSNPPASLDDVCNVWWNEVNRAGCHQKKAKVKLVPWSLIGLLLTSKHPCTLNPLNPQATNIKFFILGMNGFLVIDLIHDTPSYPPCSFSGGKQVIKSVSIKKIVVKLCILDKRKLRTL